MKPIKPAPGVFPKGRWYWLVTAEGGRRVWTKVSRIADGLPAFYAALAELKKREAGTGMLPELVADWEREVMPRHAAKTRIDDKARNKVIADALVEFRPDEVEASDVHDFLQRFTAKPRTFNAYRAQLRELMRYAEERGRRPTGSNPTQAIRTMRTPPRTRYVTDSELRRIKVAAMRGRDDRDTTSGPMLCALIDMAYLTAQPIGDLLALTWDRFTDVGIPFGRSKVADSTGAKVTIEWTPKLQDVHRRLKELRKQRRAFTPAVFTTQDGSPLTYWGASSAWQRARARSGIKGGTFHDIRAKALTDKEAREGMKEARKQGTHSTERHLATYIRRRAGDTTKATK